MKTKLAPDWTLEKRDPITGIRCPEWNSDRVGLKLWDDPSLDFDAHQNFNPCR